MIRILMFILLTLSANAAEPFTGSFDLYATLTYKNDRKSSDTINYYITDTKTAIYIHTPSNQPDMKMIFDFVDSTITSLFEMNGKKGGYILPMDDDHWPGLPESKSNTGTLTQQESFYTGESKVIDGLECKEAKVEDENYEVTLWLYEGYELSMLQVLSYQSVGKGKSKKELKMFEKFGINSLPIEMELISKTGKADVIIKLVNFKENVPDDIFSTEGHNLSKMD